MKNKGIPARRKSGESWPCRALPESEWCDSAGAGDFMGHTCTFSAHPAQAPRVAKPVPVPPPAPIDAPQPAVRHPAEMAPQPWRPMTKPIDLKHIGKLQEELGEASAAAGRCLIQGLDGAEPVTGKINRIWLQEEIADVLANIELNVAHFALDQADIERRKARKMKHLRAWHEMLIDG